MSEAGPGNADRKEDLGLKAHDQTLTVSGSSSWAGPGEGVLANPGRESTAGQTAIGKTDRLTITGHSRCWERDGVPHFDARFARVDWPPTSLAQRCRVLN